MEADPLLQPGTTFSGYQVDSLLGRGATAAVYLVQHTQKGSWHALKLLKNVDSRRKLRVEQEAIFRDELRHPNIVPATEAIEVGDAPGLVMDFVEGPTMAQWLRETDPSLPDQLALFRGIVEGVRHAHANQVIHRDLKPSNILLQPGPDDTWVPRISDFGLAKALEPEMGRFGGLTTVNTGLGTAGYAAPEQVRDASAVTVRADLYSLGCILYEAVCGVGPFAGLSTFDTLTAQRAKRYAAPDVVAPGLPPDLYELIDTLMSPDPEDRPADCEEVLRRIDAIYYRLVGTSSTHAQARVLGPTGDGLGLVPALLLCLVPLGAMLLGAAVVFGL
ncbi:MAG: serine/threonine protein kinase [Myxococcales bacterium]|nr:serine/threonine protein kinase [Myxococcales bacterium]